VKTAFKILPSSFTFSNNQLWEFTKRILLETRFRNPSFKKIPLEKNVNRAGVFVSNRDCDFPLSDIKGCYLAVILPSYLISVMKHEIHHFFLPIHRRL
jgi:hypothetical protein